MDHSSSSFHPPPPSSTTASTTLGTTSRQPTYTTAGTIYNPGSSQPPKPPLRRGRSNKWPNSASAAGHDLGFYSPALLQTSRSNEECLYESPQQYMPLQQNSDKAINPLQARDYSTEAQTMSPFGEFLYARPPSRPRSLLAAAAEMEESTRVTGMQSGDEDNSDNSLEDSDVTPDPLRGMPVKSLQNLASYPNPNQNRAQEALQGKKPVLVETAVDAEHHAGPTRLDHGPYRSEPMNPDVQQQRASTSPVYFQRNREDNMWQDPRPNLHNTPSSTSRPPQDYGVSNLDGGIESTHDARARMASRNGRIGQGVPRPLTAGPPGQRQYQRSTFESTVKAMQSPADQDDQYGSSKAKSNHSERVFNAKFFATGFRDSLMPKLEGVRTINLENHTRSLDSDFVPPPKRLDEASTILGPIGSAADSRITLSAAPHSPEYDDQAISGEERFHARIKRVNDLFYAGSDLLGKSTSDHLDDYLYFGHRRGQARAVGAVGDGRPSTNSKVYPRIDLEEASRMTVAQHAEPLVNMMYGSMLRNLGTPGPDALHEGMPSSERDESDHDAEFLG